MKSGSLVLGWVAAACAMACQEPRGPGAAPESTDGGETVEPVARRYPIVWSSLRDGYRDLYVMSPGDKSSQRLTTQLNCFVPRWSPDGNSIVFREGRDGVSADIKVANTSGDVSPLIGSEPWMDVERVSSFSPDGSKVAFASRRGGLSVDLRVFAVSSAGGEQERLVPASEVSQGEGVWSLPDGERFAYTEGAETRDIWLENVSSPDERTNLTEGRVMTPHELAWSPDGSRLAFTGFVSMHLPRELYLLDVDTRELTQLTDNDVEDRAPAWTPEGDGLLFSSNRDGDMDLWQLSLESPDDARNLIDDGDERYDDSYGHWYLGPPSRAP